MDGGGGKGVGLPLCVHVSVDLFGLKIDTAVWGEGKKSTPAVSGRKKTPPKTYDMDLGFTVNFF